MILYDLLNVQNFSLLDANVTMQIVNMYLLKNIYFYQIILKK